MKTEVINDLMILRYFNYGGSGNIQIYNSLLSYLESECTLFSSISNNDTLYLKDSVPISQRS